MVRKEKFSANALNFTIDYFGLESVIVIPTHGIQLETHRGLPGLRLSSSRRFIELAALEDVVIHEGLRGWDVRFYLTTIKLAASSAFSLEVAYEVGCSIGI